jgi:peptidoglycan/xylan/chitin deacetylase (PgdA/CDA1 family)
MKKLHTLTLILGIALLTTSCSGTVATEAPSTHTATPLPPPLTVTPQPTPTATETIRPSPSPTSIPTEAWVIQGPGDVTIPILLYHHIDTSPINSRYYVTPEKFEAQMKLLHDWGYTSITATMLIQAITQGAKLPPRPFVLTMDDGHLDNYTNAFPITQKYGFTGVLYLVSNYIGAENYMTVDQVLEMYRAGWEVGSHSMNHFDLTKVNAETAYAEVIDSRRVLEEMLGIPVLTFAYPFGAYNNAAMDYVKAAGYSGAMGASGYTPAQGLWNLYYLQRVGIKGSEDEKTFTRFLPWHGAPSVLPAETSSPASLPLSTSSP